MIRRQFCARSPVSRRGIARHVGAGNRGAAAASVTQVPRCGTALARGTLFWKAPVAAALPSGSRELWLFVHDGRCGDVWLVIGNLCAKRRAFLNVTREKVGARFAEPIHRLPHQRRPQMNTPSNLRSEYFETLGPKDARGPLLRDRQRWRDGEVVSGV